jgi:hypothetical protein
MGHTKVSDNPEQMNTMIGVDSSSSKTIQNQPLLTRYKITYSMETSGQVLY